MPRLFCFALVSILNHNACVADTLPMCRWGEELVKFVACLERHCEDRCLEAHPDSRLKPEFRARQEAMYLGGRPACYWVCGTLNIPPSFFDTSCCCFSVCKQPEEFGCRCWGRLGKHLVFSSNENVQRYELNPRHSCALFVVNSLLQEQYQCLINMVCASPAAGGVCASFPLVD